MENSSKSKSLDGPPFPKEVPRSNAIILVRVVFFVLGVLYMFDYTANTAQRGDLWFVACAVIIGLLYLSLRDALFSGFFLWQDHIEIRDGGSSRVVKIPFRAIAAAKPNFSRAPIGTPTSSLTIEYEVYSRGRKRQRRTRYRFISKEFVMASYRLIEEKSGVNAASIDVTEGWNYGPAQLLADLSALGLMGMSMVIL